MRMASPRRARPSLRDHQDRNQVVEQHLGIPESVRARLWSYLRGKVDWDDALQAGRLALMRAAELWDGERPFPPLAYVSCRNAMLRLAQHAVILRVLPLEDWDNLPGKEEPQPSPFADLMDSIPDCPEKVYLEARAQGMGRTEASQGFGVHGDTLHRRAFNLARAAAAKLENGCG